MTDWLTAPIRSYEPPPPVKPSEADLASFSTSWNPGTFVKLTLGTQVTLMFLAAIIWGLYEWNRWRKRTQFVESINSAKKNASKISVTGVDQILVDVESPPVESDGGEDTDHRHHRRHYKQCLDNQEVMPIHISVNKMTLHYDSDAALIVTVNQAVNPKATTVRSRVLFETRPIYISSPHLESFLCVIVDGLNYLKQTTGSWDFLANSNLRAAWLTPRPQAVAFEGFNRSLFVLVTIVTIACELAFSNLLSVVGIGSAYRNGYHPDLHPTELHPGETWWIKHIGFYLLVLQSTGAILLLLAGTRLWRYLVVPVVGSVVAGLLAVIGSVVGGKLSLFFFLFSLFVYIGTMCLLYLFIIPRVHTSHVIHLGGGSSKAAASASVPAIPGTAVNREEIRFVEEWSLLIQEANLFLKIQFAVVVVYSVFSALGSDGAGLFTEPFTLFMRTLCEFFLFVVATVFIVAISNSLEVIIATDILWHLGFRSTHLRIRLHSGAIWIDSNFYSVESKVTVEVPKAWGLSLPPPERLFHPPAPEIASPVPSASSGGAKQEVRAAKARDKSQVQSVKLGKK